MINNFNKIKKMQKVLLIGILCIFIFVGCGKKNTNDDNVITNNSSHNNNSIEVWDLDGSNANRSLYTIFDYKDEITYVIGHKNPDTDTVTSAIAMANLLNELGIDAKPVVAGKINNETKFVLDSVGMESPEILDNADSKQLYLVDHSDYIQSVANAKNARIVGVIDHHGIGDVANSEVINVISAPAGSTTTLVYREYLRCNVNISKSMAQLMLSGLLSDKGIISDKDSKIDQFAYKDLLSLSGIKDIEEYYLQMKNALTSYEGFTDKEILYCDYKDYEEGEIRFGIGTVDVKSINDIEPMVSRLKELSNDPDFSIENDMTIFMVHDFKYNKQCIGCIKPTTKAIEILHKALEGYNNVEFKGDYAYCSPTLSRKKDVVPSIKKAIRELENKK